MYEPMIMFNILGSYITRLSFYKFNIFHGYIIMTFYFPFMKNNVSNETCYCSYSNYSHDDKDKKKAVY
jgi:hypothetical protein